MRLKNHDMTSESPYSEKCVQVEKNPGRLPRVDSWTVISRFAYFATRRLQIRNTGICELYAEALVSGATAGFILRSTAKLTNIPRSPTSARLDATHGRDDKPRWVMARPPT